MQFLYKGSTYKMEQPEKVPEPLYGSMVAFSKNGKMQGIAYNDITEGTYFPAASLYTQPNPARLAEVRFNFGPSFVHPPVRLLGLPYSFDFSMGCFMHTCRLNSSLRSYIVSEIVV